jgi:acetyl-CoA carboxylase carboxyl transferase subunit alpha
MARDCRRIGVADEVLPEPSTGAHRDHATAAATLGEAVARHLDELTAMTPDELRADRARKLRKLGVFEQRPTADAR